MEIAWKMDFLTFFWELRIWSENSILVLLGPLVGHWDMQSCFPMFVCVFQAIKGVKNETNQKWHFCPDIHKVNEAPEGDAGCQP